MQAHDFAVYGRGGRAVQIALPLEAVPKFTPITPAVELEEGNRVRVVSSHIQEEIGRLGTVGKPTKEVKDRVRVLLDGDCLCRLFGPECLVKVFTPITPALGNVELDNPLQLPTDTTKSVMGVDARLAQLEAERQRIMAEGAVAQKGVWIEGFTTVRQRKSGKQVRYEYFHLCTWDAKEKREQKRHLGSAKDSRYLQAREAIWRRDRLEALDGAIELLKER